VTIFDDALTQDRAGAIVTVNGRSLTQTQMVASAAAIADRVHGARCVALDATASIETVIAVVGCLLAGVPVVPVRQTLVRSS
jgi:fatty acid CoA ligase FadD36